ncbi:MAG: geranylgeranyl reductase family protein [Saprospiraceae bacterium]
MKITAPPLILGAGPGGCATALTLAKLGIPCTLVDKAVFPRDKVCGDAISGKALTILRRIDSGIAQRLEEKTGHHTRIWGIRFVAPNGIATDVPFRKNYKPATDPVQGLVSRRMDFDNFLSEEVKKQPLIEFVEGCNVEETEKTDLGFGLSANGGTWKRETPLLIVANGANSQFSRHHAGLSKDPGHYAAAVRAYYKNVKGLHPDGFIELHFLKSITPGYFWIFPLPDGHANVGLGMRSDFVSKKRYNLKKEMTTLLSEHPDLKRRFAEAEQLTPIRGYPLPLGSKKLPLSGNHYMLVGDAGHLIDPLSGEGIGNAIYSGFIAAEQAAKCLTAKDFSAEFLKPYDERIARVLGSEMKISYQLQKLMSRMWLVNFSARLVARNPNLIYTISDMYADLSMRQKALNPIFWLKMMLGKK